MDEFQFRECDWEDCRFRFPVQIDTARTPRCPNCGSATHEVGMPSRGLGKTTSSWNGIGCQALLDNIRSIHNVGSIFRSADGAGISHLHLCGLTATPAHPKLAKAALGAQDKVPWSYNSNGVDAASALKERGHQLWGIESTVDSQPFFGSQAVVDQRAVIIVGNERAGIDPGILALCDRVFSLPMYGFKQSLNVAVAFGIVAYHLNHSLNLTSGDAHINDPHMADEPAN